jgi:hypothetical protein
LIHIRKVIVEQFTLVFWIYKRRMLFAIARLPKKFKRVDAPTLGFWLTKGKLGVSLT